MSIVAAATVGLDVWIVRAMVVMTILSLLAAAISGVFRRRSVAGPIRWDERETAGTFFLLAMIGVGAWLAVPIFYGSRQVRPITPATAPPTTQTVATATTSPATTQSAVAPPQPAAIDLVRISTMGAVAGFVALLGAHALARPAGLRRLGLDFTSLVRAVPRAAVGVMIVLPLMTWAGALTQLLWERLHLEHPNQHELLKILGESGEGSLRMWIILSAVLAAPLAEELLFRGTLQTMLVMLFTGARRRVAPFTPDPVAALAEPPAIDYAAPTTATSPAGGALDPRFEVLGRWLAILFTSLLFAAIHPWWTVPPIFFLSVCLGYAYERTGNLWVPILMHAAFNASSVVLYLYTMQAG